MCARARACVFSSRSPFMFHSFSIRSFRVFSPRSFRVCSLFVPHPFSTCPPFVLRFILHLFSIRSPFVFHPPYVCFSFVVIYFTLILHFPLIRFFIRFFFIYLPFIFHLFSISVPFYFSVSRRISPFFHEAKYGSCAVKAQYRFVAWSIFRSNFREANEWMSRRNAKFSGKDSARQTWFRDKGAAVIQIEMHIRPRSGIQGTWRRIQGAQCRHISLWINSELIF